MFRRTPFSDRRGSVTVLAAFLLVIVVGMLAFAIDISFVQAAKSEVQRSADSAAMAACWELYRERSSNNDSGTNLPQNALVQIEDTANAYAQSNQIIRQSPSLADDGSDVTIGYLDWINNPDGELDTSDYETFNSVEVSVKRTANSNGELPLFFARIFGFASTPAEFSSRAGFATEIDGFDIKANSGTLNVMPFAVDEETWNDAINGIGDDKFGYNEDTKSIIRAGNNVPEFSMYPTSTGSQANRGTVDVGGSENATSRVSRQILSGVSKADLDALGKDFELDASGKLMLGGDPGISNGFRDELASIIGEKRVIMVYSKMKGNGNNGVYTIVKFVGVRIMDVKLIGNPKHRHLTVEPTPTVVRHAVVNTAATDTSDHLFTPVILFQ